MLWLQLELRRTLKEMRCALIVVCGALGACSLLANFDGFVSDKVRELDATTRDANTVADGGTNSNDSRAGDPEAGRPPPRCGDMGVFCDNFERADLLGPGAPPWGPKQQGGGSIAIVTPSAPPAPEGTRVGEFSVTARDAGVPFSAASLYVSNTSVGYIYVSERIWMEKRLTETDNVELFTLESSVGADITSRILISLDANETVFSQYDANIKLLGPQRRADVWPVNKWTTLEAIVDLVGRKANFRRDGVGIGVLDLKNTASGTSTQLVGISYFGNSTHGAFKMRLDDIVIQMIP
jgi:hypothetical protein